MSPVQKRNLLALFAGVLFGAGLAAAGMTDPRKVQAFLDLFGAWDPTLVFVMGAAVLVTVSCFRLVLRRPAPLFDEKFHVPTRKDIDFRLVFGSVLFGAGWGLFGYCPAPAIGSLVYGHAEAFLFVGAMLVGVYAEWAWRKVTAKPGC